MDVEECEFMTPNWTCERLTEGLVSLSLWKGDEFKDGESHHEIIEELL
jgi:hypothetical protein